MAEVGKHTVVAELAFIVTEDRGEGVDNGFLDHKSHTKWSNVPKHGVVGLEGAILGKTMEAVLQLGVDDITEGG